MICHKFWQKGATRMQLALGRCLSHLGFAQQSSSIISLALESSAVASRPKSAQGNLLSPQLAVLRHALPLMSKMLFDDSPIVALNTCVCLHRLANVENEIVPQDQIDLLKLFSVPLDHLPLDHSSVLGSGVVDEDGELPVDIAAAHQRANESWLPQRDETYEMWVRRATCVLCVQCDGSVFRAVAPLCGRVTQWLRLCFPKSCCTSCHLFLEKNSWEMSWNCSDHLQGKKSQLALKLRWNQSIVGCFFFFFVSLLWLIKCWSGWSIIWGCVTWHCSLFTRISEHFAFSTPSWGSHPQIFRFQSQQTHSDHKIELRFLDSFLQRAHTSEFGHHYGIWLTWMLLFWQHIKSVTISLRSCSLRCVWKPVRCLIFFVVIFFSVCFWFVLDFSCSYHYPSFATKEYLNFTVSSSPQAACWNIQSHRRHWWNLWGESRSWCRWPNQNSRISTSPQQCSYFALSSFCSHKRGKFFVLFFFVAVRKRTFINSLIVAFCSWGCPGIASVRPWCPKLWSSNCQSSNSLSCWWVTVFLIESKKPKKETEKKRKEKTKQKQNRSNSNHKSQEQVWSEICWGLVNTKWHLHFCKASKQLQILFLVCTLLCSLFGYFLFDFGAILKREGDKVWHKTDEELHELECTAAWMSNNFLAAARPSTLPAGGHNQVSLFSSCFWFLFLFFCFLVFVKVEVPHNLLCFVLFFLFSPFFVQFVLQGSVQLVETALNISALFLQSCGFGNGKDCCRAWPNNIFWKVWLSGKTKIKTSSSFFLESIY